MKRKTGWLTVLCALCAATPALGQDEPEDTIVVTGDAEPPTRGEVVDQAQAISRVGPYQLYEEALPRVEAPLCPGIAGLGRDYAEQMADRIRANAARLEIPLAAIDCEPNLVVAFVDDGRSFLSTLEQNQPGLFRLVGASERREIVDEAAPVHVWSNIALRWTGQGDPPPGWPILRPSVRGQLDRTGMPEARDIVFSLIVFDRAAVAGLTLTQLADYATMRGLSHTRPAESDGPMTTILALFADPVAAAAEMTSFDIGYLRSLYAGEANRPAVTKFLGVRHQAELARRESGEPSELQAPPHRAARDLPSIQEKPRQPLKRKRIRSPRQRD